jgi:TRAP-type mannitol/chloroaromatic compound transport system permease large subunit
MKFILAINTLSSQAWAGVLIVLGLCALPLCWHYRQPDTIAAGIVAAGIGMAPGTTTTSVNETPASPIPNASK